MELFEQLLVTAVLLLELVFTYQNIMAVGYIQSLESLDQWTGLQGGYFLCIILLTSRLNHAAQDHSTNYNSTLYMYIVCVYWLHLPIQKCQAYIKAMAK